MTHQRIALVGAGRMGANHARVIAESDRARLALVVDIDPGRARQLATRWNTRWTADLDEAHDMDAVVVSSSTSSHFGLARALMDMGTPLLVEKPLTLDIEQTRDLVRAADDEDGVLMCGFVERFNASFAQLRDRCVLSRTRHIRTVRIGRSPREPQSNVVADVLLHDLDLVIRLFPDDVVIDLRADGSDWNSVDRWPESVNCQITLASGTVATLHASRVSAVRERSITITDDDGRFERADLLAHHGGPLVAQFARFMDLVSRTSADRDAERRTVLPSHEIAHRIEGLLARAAPRVAVQISDSSGAPR